MKICLVTAFPPSHERLNEYGYHLARELQRNPFLSLTVLADEFDGNSPELPDFDVVRCWRPNQLHTPVRLLRTIRQLRPDVVWYNLVFSSFGVNPAAAFLGLCAPALTRGMGCCTHVTLHHLMEGVNLEDSSVRFPALYRLFGQLATRLLLRSHSVTVLLPAYRRTLVEKYRGEHIHLRSHGVFSEMPQPPDFSLRGNPPRVLAFGKWGTYKRLELLLQAFPRVWSAVPGCRLTVAGEDHPATPGYLREAIQQFGHIPNLEFTGYVAEQDLPKLMANSSVLVMPYSSSTGASGVAHQACQFGLPIVCADLGEFREMAEMEELAIEFYKPGDGQDLAQKLMAVLQNPERQREMAEQNYSAAVRHTMPEVVGHYLRTFDWQLGYRAKAGKPALRRRRTTWPHAISPLRNGNLPAPYALALEGATGDQPTGAPSAIASRAKVYNIAEHRRPVQDEDESRAA